MDLQLESRERTGTIFNWLILSPLFILACTPVEFDPQLGNPLYADLIRTAAMISFLVGLLLTAGWSLTKNGVVLALTAGLYFLLTNVTMLTALIAIYSVGIVGSFVAAAALSGFPDRFDFFLRNYILFHCFGFFVALILWLLAGELVDLHALVFPFSSSRAKEFLGYARLSGFQIEPGTYANAIFLFVFLRALVRKRISGLQNFFAIVTTLLTFSAWSIIGASFYLIALGVEFLSSRQKLHLQLRLILGLSLLLLFLAVLPVIIPNLFNADYVAYLHSRFNADEGSARMKVEAWDALMSALQDPRSLLGHPILDPFCYYCQSPQDLGSFLNMAYYLGLAPTFAIVGFALHKLKKFYGLAYCVMFLPMIFMKFYFYDVVIWLTLGTMMTPRRDLWTTREPIQALHRFTVRTPTRMPY